MSIALLELYKAYLILKNEILIESNYMIKNYLLKYMKN